MQAMVPEITDLSKEPESTLKLYGPDCLVRGPLPPIACWQGNYRKAECALCSSTTRMGQPYSLPHEIKGQCKDVDQASAALITDLKQRGLLDETLVIWGGEFGRTNYCQGKLTRIIMAGIITPGCYHLDGGRRVKPGVYGETDDFGYNITRDPVHVHDFHATVLHLNGTGS